MGSAAPSLFHRATNGPAFVQARYGTARGLVKLCLSLAAMAAGRYRSFQRIEWEAVRRLVFVCSGNICRSPYAERRAAEYAFPTVSVALRGSTGDPADTAAKAASRAVGLDLERHSSLAIADLDLLPGDLLIAMEPWQARLMEGRYGDRAQVTLLGLWSSPMRPHIHDPHRLGAAYFSTCFRIIDSGVAGLGARLRP